MFNPFKFAFLFSSLALLSILLCRHSVTKDIEPSYYLGAMGMSLQTAYWGLKDVAEIKEGETVVISGAAGATGSIVSSLPL
jgi:NADPH-dependent curcumin reductase CurA